jgi:hypothetical protein
MRDVFGQWPDHHTLQGVSLARTSETCVPGSDKKVICAAGEISHGLSPARHSLVAWDRRRAVAPTPNCSRLRRSSLACARDRRRQSAPTSFAADARRLVEPYCLRCRVRIPSRQHQLDSASWVEATHKTWRRERDSNPRRAFDPYTLSRAGHQCSAVYAIMGIGSFIAIPSTSVHSRLR